ncbi:MAG TPA: hypothetical protein DCQ92_04285 [Verrucomicrobia subdivision 3 bacterium]|nr:hypothetical protein [Limisphaerales bacterium]
MKQIFLLFFLSMATSLYSGQAKTVSFRDLSGIEYSNVVILTIEKDGVLLRYGDEFRYDRVKFTNMSEQAQLQCGYDAKKLQQQREEKAAKEKLAREQFFEQRAAAIKQMQEAEILSLSRLVYPISIGDFPKTDSAKATCKELVAELKGVNTGLKLGLSYSKFSDLLTDTAIKIQKMRDLSKDELPAVFQTRMDDCIRIYNDSRDDWRKKIDSDIEETKAWREYFVQKAWAESGIHLTMLTGIIDSRTNVNELVINQAIDIVRDEKRAFDKGVLPIELRSYKAISLLSDEELIKRLNEKLASR